MKRERLRQILAQDLLELALGEQLPTIRELAAAHNSSIGTVQAILAEFEREGAIQTERQGWMGTYLRGRSLAHLWSAAQGGDPLVIALPLPSTLICEGLATGIKTLLAENGIEAFLIFLRGSRRRLEALRRKHCNAAVISTFAASTMCGAGEKCVLELPPQTYAQEHRVFYGRDPETIAHRQLRVAIDRDSVDLQRLTEMEFAEAEVEFVSATFLQYVQMLEQGTVDAVVWDTDEAKGRLPATHFSRPLSDRVLQQIGMTNTRASLVARHNDSPSEQVIRQCLDTPRLLQIQSEVMSGTRVPAY